jgi:hypothetical protein
MEDINHLLADQNLLESKKLNQIISFLGEGKLHNEDQSFRKFLKKVANDLLVKYAEECLEKSFQDSGLALQDIVNEIGSRLGFQVTHGLYRGNKNDIGYDGIWRQLDEWSLVVEVKTTDAYRVPLDTIARYRTRLIETKSIVEDKCSILIVVGRDDTGELEAQIRGSKHAWDIRLISIESLINLLKIKESLSDESTAQKISIALRPFEFTRVDRLIDLLFLAIKDVEVEENADEPIDLDKPRESSDLTETQPKRIRSSFQEPVLSKIQSKTGISFFKKSRSSYSSNDASIGIIISISKEHPAFNNQFDARYWFAFHPHQDAFLKNFSKGYACYGCGSENIIFMIPIEFLRKRLEYMWKTDNGDRDYKHVVIYRNNERYFLRTNIDDKEHYDELEEFKI